MSMIDRSLDGMAALSGHLGVMLRRRLREVGGIALISLGMMAALALASWSVQDPSLSHATDAPVHNILGLPGAITAMGTGDDTTYLLIGQEPAGKSLATDMDTTERRLRDVMVDFRPLDELCVRQHASNCVVDGAPEPASLRGYIDKRDRTLGHARMFIHQGFAARLATYSAGDASRRLVLRHTRG